MRVALMQPYFFPYVGYFSLIKDVDRFILGDTVQYIAQGWINRNRILKSGADGWDYVIVPLIKHTYKANIKDVKIVDNNDWSEKILRQIAHYKKKAPYYNNVIGMLTECFKYDGKSISELNGICLSAACKYIGIDYKVEFESQLGFDYSGVDEKEGKIISLCHQLKATDYINLPGGQELYNKETFEKNNLKLNFVKPAMKEYNQFRKTFENGLSILDVMMYNSPEEVNAMVNDYTLI